MVTSFQPPTLGKPVLQDEVVRAFQTTRTTLIKNNFLMGIPSRLAVVAWLFDVDEDELLDRFAREDLLEFYRQTQPRDVGSS